MLSSKGTHAISEELNANGVPTKKGGRWTPTTVRGMISNEKYTGDVIFQKTYTDSQFNRHVNYGQKDQYAMADHHEAIISREIFEAANALVEQRGKEKGIIKGSEKYQSRYCFSGKIVCGECGDTFKRRIHWNNRGCKSIVWRCCSRLENTGHACHSRTVNETLLEQVVIDAINRVLCQKDDFLQTLRANIATVILQGDALSPEVIDEQLNKLQKELLKKVNQKDDYDAIADEILRLRDQRRQAEVDSVIKDEQMKQNRDLQDFVKSQSATLTEFDETLVSRLIAKITVF